MSHILSGPQAAPRGLHADFVRVLPELVQARGQPAQPVWQALGLSPDRQHPDERVPASALSLALQTAADLCADPLIGLHAAQAVRPAHLGALGYALMSCQQGETGLRLYERFQTLLNNELLTHYQIRHELIEVRHEPVSGDLPRHAMFWWFLLGARLSFARWVSGRDLRPVRLDLPCPPPPQADQFQHFVGSLVRYDTADCREVMPALWLSWLNPNADPDLHALMHARTERQLYQDTAARASQLQGHARQIIAQALERDGPITLEQVAEALRPHLQDLPGAPGPHFKRHLADIGLPFKELVEDVRRAEALRQLRDTMLPLKEIAQRTGYAEPSSFHRAVRRWTGLTPAQVRARR